jgi:hypothetical protein
MCSGLLNLARATKMSSILSHAFFGVTLRHWLRCDRGAQATTGGVRRSGSCWGQGAAVLSMVALRTRKRRSRLRAVVVSSSVSPSDVRHIAGR